MEVVENKSVTIEKTCRNAVTTSNSQKDMRFTYVKTIYLCHRRHIWAKALIGAYEAQTSTTYPSVVHQWINLSTCFMNKTISSQHK